VITAISFLMERRTFASFSSNSSLYMTLTAAAFGVYAILSGLVVPEYSLPGLGWLTYENVFTVTLMPIYFWRMVFGIIFTVLIIKTLHMFDIEYGQRLETAEAERALAQERQRIARDLHDGVVQAIYATGLQLEVAAKKAATEPEKTSSTINLVVAQLNEVITNIRRYIYNLAAAGESEIGFESYIKKIADEYSATGSIPVRITVEGKKVKLTPKQKQNIAFIVQECLSNIVKHARASEAEIKLEFRQEALAFSVLDNGVGIGDGPGKAIGQISGRGLKGMRERAEALDADIVISRNPKDGGTVVLMMVPYKKDVAEQ
jgi:signal transduction histidine kinase